MTETTRRRAEEAMSMLNSATLKEIFEEMDLAIVAEWREAVAPDQREALHVKQRILRDVRSALFRCVVTAADVERKHAVKDGVFSAFCRKFINPQAKQE